MEFFHRNPVIHQFIEMQTDETSGAQLFLTNLVLQLMRTSATILYILCPHLLISYSTFGPAIDDFVSKRTHFNFLKSNFFMYSGFDNNHHNDYCHIISFLRSTLQAFIKVFKHFQVMLKKSMI